MLDFAFPGGNDSPRLRELALEVGYRHVYTSKPGFAGVTDRVRARFTVRAGTPVAAVARLADARLSAAFLLDGALFGAKRVLGVGVYRKLRRILIRRPSAGNTAA